MNRQIFREYDIRGRVDVDLNEEVAELIGRGAGTLLKREGLKRMVVGRDNRLSSESYSQAVIRGLLSTGCSVTDIGIVPTPVFYFSIYQLKKEGGIMVTGSHNPPEFNGFKVAQETSTLYGERIQDIRRIIEAGEFSKGAGKVDRYYIIDDYIALIKSKIKLDRSIKVVVDAGNATAGLVAPPLLRELGCEVKELFCQLDGNFPHHHPDPTVPENLIELIHTVTTLRYDLGCSYDGDADRLGVVDNRGKIIWGDQLLVIFSRDLLSRQPGAKILFEVKCSQTLVDDIKKHGGQPVMWKTGHSLIKKKMREEGIPLAGEMSGHLFFADEYYGYDDAIYASCRLIQILSRTGRSISELLADLPRTYSTPEIRRDCPDEVKFKLVERMKEYFSQRYQTIDVDGVRVVFDDGWGLVRPSNTQPVIVMRFEATTPQGLERIQELMEGKLEEFASEEKCG